MYPISPNVPEATTPSPCREAQNPGETDTSRLRKSPGTPSRWALNNVEFWFTTTAVRPGVKRAGNFAFDWPAKRPGHVVKLYEFEQTNKRNL